MLSQKLASKDAGSGLAALLPSGMLAVAVRVDDVVGVAGFIYPGNSVDVIVTMRPRESSSQPVSKIVLQKIKVLAVGKKVFTDKCQKCHGQKGLGDGPDADPDHAEEMNLTNPKRADRNSDGVVFYKVMNGRRSPKMPAFKDELSKEQIWSVVAYAQSLRKK